MNLNWAVGENSHKALESRLLDSSAREIIWFNILDFISYVTHKWVNNPNIRTPRRPASTNVGHSHFVAKAKSHFENGGWMDPSDVQGLVRKHRCKTSGIILEGKHRLVAAIQLGETYAPFSVPHKLVEDLKSIIVVRDT